VNTFNSATITLILGIPNLNDEDIGRILTNTGLAQFGDSLLNFAYSIALTETTGRPRGIKVQDKILADAAAKAGLRKRLPRRVARGDVANSLEALLGHVWLRKMITLEEIVSCLKLKNLDPSNNFSVLAEVALSKLRKQS
jgi:ribonuclease III-like protein